MDKTTKNIINELAIKYNIKPELIEVAVRSQFSLLAKTIKESQDKGFKIIKLPEFGKFYYSPYKLKKYLKINDISPDQN
jgi:hypothetical protein